MSSVYLVDDHQIMREGLRALLEARGHRVVGESSSLTGVLASLQRLRPEVLLLDLNLDGRSGFELLAELQRRQSSTRCVVLTMSAQPRDVAEALRMGASGYVLKGSAGSDLMGAVEAAAQGKKYLGAQVTDLALEVLTRPQREDALSTLSARERQVIVMVANGQSSAQIGLELNLSPKTVATYRSRLMAKLGVADLAGLIRMAIERGLIESGDPWSRHRRVSDAADELSTDTGVMNPDLPTDGRSGSV